MSVRCPQVTSPDVVWLRDVRLTMPGSVPVTVSTLPIGERLPQGLQFTGDAAVALPHHIPGDQTANSTDHSNY